MRSSRCRRNETIAACFGTRARVQGKVTCWNGMRALFALIALAATVAASSVRREAPADEYFGPLKMSALQIRNSIGKLGRAYHERSKSDDDILHDAQLDEDAFRLWATKYPADRWLAPTAFHLEQLYQAIQSGDARRRAGVMLAYIVDHFPTTKEATLSRIRLHQGFPALHAESPLHPPTPSAAPTAAGTSPVPTAFASAFPGSPLPGTALPPSPVPTRI